MRQNENAPADILKVSRDIARLTLVTEIVWKLSIVGDEGIISAAETILGKDDPKIEVFRRTVTNLSGLSLPFD